ncbi:MAG: SHOCT domain-containing protein [Candidatus Methanoperedens sp.]|nr:SHOCT domain-containing protein [Candidatus Methanoperedens sp.]
MDGYGFGVVGYGMLILAFIFWILVFVGLILLIKYLWEGGRGKRVEESALEVLKKRYVRGEISKEEFEEKKKDLS